MIAGVVLLVAAAIFMARLVVGVTHSNGDARAAIGTRATTRVVAGTRTVSAVASATPAAGHTDASQKAAFAVLAEPGVPASQLPQDVQNAVKAASRHFSIDAANVHAAHFDGLSFWIIPGAGQICIAADDADGLGMTCGSDASAGAGKLSFVQRSTTGADDVLYGLAPDDVTKITVAGPKGSSTIVPSDNVYAVRTKGIDKLEVSRGNGSSASEALGG